MITLINPNLITQKGDILGSGIPYFPISLAYLASVLEKNNYDINVIDAFGNSPFKVRIEGNYIIQGMTVDEVLKKVSNNSSAIILYCGSVMAHYIVKQIAIALKEHLPHIPLILIENTQAVTAYSLKFVTKEFHDIGVDYIVIGESEERAVNVLNNLKYKKNIQNMDGISFDLDGIIVYNPKATYIDNLDELTFPAWELFPIENYWKLGYAHGPMQGKYLPLLTSRGCPFCCRFCVIPSTNNRRWRARSARNVVDEIEYMINKFEVREFHIEDVNPTTDEKRIIEICKELINRNIKIRWKLVSGSKIETIKINTLEWMNKAGCNYISFSPESGSEKVLKLMNKPFNHKYALEMVSVMEKLGIKSQACFVLGFPGEEPEDIKLTMEYMKKLIKNGIDEVAFFIMTPIPGTETFSMFNGYNDYSQLTFSPSWRKDYEFLDKSRRVLYNKFLLWKILFRPVKVFKQCINFVLRNFETKMEMTPFRALSLKLMMLKMYFGGSR